MSIYLDSLINELNNLWKGIKVVEISRKRHGKVFHLRAILMWTMHDYLRYRNVRKYVVWGYYACLVCGPKLQGHYSAHLHNMVYKEHNKFLPIDYLTTWGQDQWLIPSRMSVREWK